MQQYKENDIINDFYVAAHDMQLAQIIIKQINSTSMSIKVKELGLVEHFNGVDMSQTKW